MVQDIAPPLTRQLELYRHQAVAAPTLLDDGTLAPSHVTQVLTQEGVVGRNRLFPPHLTLWTFLLQVLFARWLLPRGARPPAPLDDRQRPNALRAPDRQLL